MIYKEFIIGLLLFGSISSVSWTDSYSQSVEKYRLPMQLSVEKKDSLKNYSFKKIDHNKALFRSLIIPGWGQLTNKQAWKIPIVYGVIGTLAWNMIRNNQRYRDYRAAYYNYTQIEQTDMRFGTTPQYITDIYGTMPSNNQLQTIRRRRDGYLTSRDQFFIYTLIAYFINGLEAYISSHLRTFDVSDNLEIRLTPEITPLNKQAQLSIQIGIR